jgi:hypothetical protein
MMIFTVINKRYLTHNDFAEILDIFLEFFLEFFFPLYWPLYTVHMRTKKSVKRVTNSM